MDQKYDKLYPSAPFEKKNIDLEQRLEKKLNDVNSFNNHMNNIKEMITYFKDKINKSIKKYKNFKTITTILKSFGTFASIATPSSFITLSLTGIGLIEIPISTASACALSIGNKVLYEVIINKYNKYKKHYEKDQQTIKSFDKLYRNSLQDNVIDESEHESLCNIFTKYVDVKQKRIFFINMKTKVKLNFFSSKKNFNLEPKNLFCCSVITNYQLFCSMLM